MKNAFVSILYVFLFAACLTASEPSIWSVNSRADVLKGDARGVSIDQNGTIILAPRVDQIFKTEQSYIWSSAADAAGNFYLGTGGDGKIFKVSADGKGSLFADLNELNVSALVVGNSGELYAATSPDGKVYRVARNGQPEVYFDPKEKYIWALALLSDGSLAVGTGESGRIYRVRTAGAERDASLFYDTSETHIISLAADNRGNLYAGTDSNGLVLRFGPDAKPFALLDSTLREIHDIKIGPDNSVYVLAISDSAAATPVSAAGSKESENKTVSGEKPGGSTPEPPQKSRYDLSGAKSAVYRILPDGASDIVWASNSILGFSIYPHQTGNGVLLGTSDKGRIYDVTNEGRETLVLQSDASQISTLRSFGTSIYATSSNQGNLYRIGPGSAVDGSYESSILDARSTATWGRIWWRATGDVQLQTRSGNTEKADETWSTWSSVYLDPKGAQISSPKAKYLQWRANLKSNGPGASVSDVNVSYLARNIAPEILQIQILPTNVGLVANPPLQIDPNINLAGLDPVLFGIPNSAVPPRRVYQRAARSLQWTAEDRNGDKLVYDVYFRESGASAFKLLRGDLSDNFYTIDGQSLADGRYVFKIVVRDSGSNPSPGALAGEMLTDPVEIDNTAPRVSAVGLPQKSGAETRVIFEATDSGSFVQRAEYSVNGGDWRPVYSDDGISDGPIERYTIALAVTTPGEYSVTLRAFDADGNTGNARITVKN